MDYIVEKGQSIIGKSLKETIPEYRLFEGKGQLGQMVEEGLFGYAINSRQEADFYEEGIELKVAPLKVTKPKMKSDSFRERKGRAAKERIVITMIDYFKLSMESWDRASFLGKMKMLLMFYLHEEGKRPDEMIFELVELWEPTNAEWAQIKKDWMVIQGKVLNGEAHLISEGDTMLLGACTKGSTAAKSIKKQPFSTLIAKQRAFSLKSSYVNIIIDQLYAKQSGQIDSKFIKLLWKDSNMAFEDFILQSINNLSNRSLHEIKGFYNINRERIAKHYIRQVVDDMLAGLIDSKTSIQKTLESYGVELKTIVIGPDGKPKEHMSFEQINYCEIVNESWELSQIREKFELNKHFWVVFQTTHKYQKQSELDDSEITLKAAFFWNMPIEDLDGPYFELWQDTVEKIKENRYSEFISSGSVNRVGHIRPKAIDGMDKCMTPQNTLELKKCFWLNNTYVAEQIKKRTN